MYGIAVDIGSTTVAGHLCDLTSGEVLSSAGVMNPQIRFGEDLMSRVSYVMMNKGGEKELTFAIRNALNLLVVELAEKANVSADKILEIVMVGNPIMHHILLGIDPTPLGAAPFVLATDEATSGEAPTLLVQFCRRAHIAAPTCSCSLTLAPMRKLSWAITPGNLPHLHQLAQHSKALNSVADNERLLAQSRRCASIEKRWSRASK
jgi:uncharacterized 2Fe-2S/4Fe-4S cluster protein (DUF4445 family)